MHLKINPQNRNRRDAAMVGLCVVVAFSMHCQRDAKVQMFAGPATADASRQRSDANMASADRTESSQSSDVLVADAQTVDSGDADMAPGGAMVAVASIQAKPVALPETANYEDFAKRDPLGFLRFCWDRYKTNVQDYRCTFTKRERINGEYMPEQIADVRFRESPFSVDMTFTKNIGECARALYVADKWVDDEGNQQAWAKPGGAIVRLLISKILQPIHGARAQNASRRTIDQFGFGKSFELIIRYSAKAQAENALTLNYTGEGSVGDRPTYQFERLLPYDGNEDNYPDRLLVFHIDQESLLPVACYAYSDKEGNDLLGSYIYTDVKLNPGYSPEDFDPDVINF